MARLDPLTRVAFVVGCLAGLTSPPAHAQRAPSPLPPSAQGARPLAAPPAAAALEATLRSLALDPLCTVEGGGLVRCEAHAIPPGSAEAVTLRAIASAETRTVFLSVPELAHAAPDAPGTPARLRRLAELNWELLLGKLEWNSTSGEIRLTMVLPTHGGLDRDALGAMVRALLSLAARLGPVLRETPAR